MGASDLRGYEVEGYLPSIGIECHVQLSTKTKLFTAVTNESGLSEAAQYPCRTSLPRLARYAAGR